MIDLVNAINTKQIAMFEYKNRTRKVEVYALGMSKADNMIIRCFELNNKGFKLFLVDEIKGFKLLPQQWARIRSGYSKNDKSMVKVIAQV